MTEKDKTTDALLPKKLWLWKNFVNSRPEYWAFDNRYPRMVDGGDPLILGEPCGYALFKASENGEIDHPETTDESQVALIMSLLANKQGTPTTAHVPDGEVIEVMAQQICNICWDLAGRPALVHDPRCKGVMEVYGMNVREIAKFVLTALRSHYNVTITRKE